MSRCPLNPLDAVVAFVALGAVVPPGTAEKYEAAADDAGDEPSAWSAVGVEADGLVDGALLVDVGKLAFDSDAVNARAWANRLTVGGADIGRSAHVGDANVVAFDNVGSRWAGAGGRAALGTRPEDPDRVVGGRASARPA